MAPSPHARAAQLTLGEPDRPFRGARENSPTSPLLERWAGEAGVTHGFVDR